MQTNDWIASLQKWLTGNEPRLNHEHIRVEVLGITPYTPSSIHLDFFAERHEATVQLWDNGLSDFHVLDWRAADKEPDYQVEVTHHEFQSEDELFAALEQLVRRLAPAQNQDREMSDTPEGQVLTAAG